MLAREREEIVVGEQGAKGGGQRGLVWHYTDTAGLLGVVRDHEIWAHHSRFMNDQVEGEFFDELLEKFVNDNPLGLSQSILKDWLALLQRTHSMIRIGLETDVDDRNNFLVCGSGSGDELTLWRNYGQGTRAYAVAFDRQAPLGPLLPEGRDKLPALGSRIDLDGWAPVMYEDGQTFPSEPRKELQSIVDVWNKVSPDENVQGEKIVFWHGFLNISLKYRGLIKHKAFEDEREERLAFSQSTPGLWKFRSGRYGLTPYIPLTNAPRWGEIVAERKPLPIKAIQLSPGATLDDVNAVHALLETHGYGAQYIWDDEGDEGPTWRGTVWDHQVKVSRSAAPLRS